MFCREVALTLRGRPKSSLSCPWPDASASGRDLAIVGWWRAWYRTWWFTGRLWLRWGRALLLGALKAASRRPLLSGGGRRAGSSSLPGFSRHAVLTHLAGTGP